MQRPISRRNGRHGTTRRASDGAHRHRPGHIDLYLHLQAHPDYQPLTQELLTGVETGRWTAVTSTVTIMELTARPWQLNRPAVARTYEALLVHFPHLILADVTRDVARQAAQLRAHYRLRPADALQVATALIHGATAFVTNDRFLTRLTPTLDMVMLDDFVPS